MAKSLNEVMRFLENYTLAWHHWLMILSLLKLGGRGTKAQIMPIYRQEGFSPHAIDGIFSTDVQDLGEVVRVEGGFEILSDSSTLVLTDNPDFQKFIRKHLKHVMSTFKLRQKKK